MSSQLARELSKIILYIPIEKYKNRAIMYVVHRLTNLKRRNIVKVLKKSKGKWIAVSLAVATMVLTNQAVSAQEEATTPESHEVAHLSSSTEVTEEVLGVEPEVFQEATAITPEPPTTFVQSMSLPPRENFESETNALNKEQQLALERISIEWQANSVEHIKGEIARQSELGLSNYVIQWGDTLFNISQAVNTDLSTLVELNQIDNPDLIYTGELLKGVIHRQQQVAETIETSNQLQEEQFLSQERVTSTWTANSVGVIQREIERQSKLGLSDYVIQWGDTLYNLSQAAGTNFNDLVKQNNIMNPDLIYTGARLKGILPFNPPTISQEPELIFDNAKGNESKEEHSSVPGNYPTVELPIAEFPIVEEEQLPDTKPPAEQLPIEQPQEPTQDSVPQTAPTAPTKPTLSVERYAEAYKELERRLVASDSELLNNKTPNSTALYMTTKDMIRNDAIALEARLSNIVTQTELDEVTALLEQRLSQLNEAAQLLVERVDATSLSQLMESVPSMPMIEDKTPSSVTIYQARRNALQSSLDAALQRARAIIANPNATTEELTQATEQLNGVYVQINQASSLLQNQANRTNAQEKADSLNALVTTLENLDTTNKTPRTLTSFRRALNQANMALTSLNQGIGNLDIAQADLDHLSQVVENAHQALTTAQEQLANKGDKTILHQLWLSLREQVNKTGKTPKSIQAYEEAIAQLFDEQNEVYDNTARVLNDANATQEEINAQLARVQAVKDKENQAKTLLVDQANKTNARTTQRELDEALVLAEAVELDNKTPESVGAFSSAKNEASRLQKALVTLLADANATQAEVDNLQQETIRAKEALVHAQSQLREQPQVNQPIELSDKKIEFRNVSDAYLYRLSEDKHMVKLLHLDHVPTDVNDLFIKVNLEDDKEVWLNVDNVKLVNNEYIVTGRLPELVQFNGSNAVQENYSIKVAKKSTEEGVYTSFKQLIEAIRKDVAGTFIIGSDLTATEIPMDVNSSSYLEDVTFLGTLKSKDNHRFTIYDLKKSLFKDLFNATVSNIHLANVDVKATQAEAIGSLAHTLDNSRIENVSAEGNVAGRVLVAGLVGVADKNSRISNSSFVGRVSSAQSTAGLVGRVTRGSTVDKSYADVNITGSLTTSNRLGGLVAEINADGSLTNSYVKGTISNYGDGDANVGGAIGAVYGAPERQDNGRIENVISYVKVLNGHDFIGNVKNLLSTEKNLSNNAVVINASDGWHVEKDGVTKVEKAVAEQRSKTMYAKPTNTHITLTNASTTNYAQVKDYNPANDKAYRNMAKLLPLYDRHTIVKEGNKLTASDNLYNKEVESVVAYINDKIATNLHANKQSINKLLIRYTDGTKETVTLSNPTPFSNTGVVEYTTSKGVSYHTNQLIKDNSALVGEIVALINSKQFDHTIFNPANLTDWETSERDKRLEKLYLRDSFDKVKPKMEEIVRGLLEHTAVGDYTNGKLREYMKERLTKNVNALLVGSTYLGRWYDFAQTFDTLLYGMTTYNREADSLDLLTELGHESIDTLRSFATQATYAQTVAKYTGILSVVDFVKKNYELYKTNEASIDDWIKQTSKAYIVTRDSKSRSEQTGSIFKRMSVPESQYMLLPLLNIKDEHVYAIFSSNSTSFGIFDSYMEGITKGHSKYDEQMRKVRAKVDNGADAIQRYFDVLYRLLKKESVDRLVNTNLQVFDTLRGRTEHDWSDEYGPNAYESVKAFISPINRWQQYQKWARAYAPVAWNTELVHFMQARMLDEDGLSTLTHEHMHNLDDKVILGGHGKRFGHGAESYAMGLFQSHGTATDTMGMNLIFKDDVGNDSKFAIHNTTPERFQSMEDFETYMRRSFDVLYTLEVAEAEALISKGERYIRDNYRVLAGLNENSGHLSDILRSVWNKLSGKKLTRDLFVDVGLVSNLVRDRVYGLDDYIQLGMFEAHYGIMENSEGVSGGLTFRRVAFELLAEKGYYEGMIPYISNQYASESFEKTGKVASDTFIFKKIFGDQYKDFKEFRKAMFNRREQAAEHLKYVTIFHGNNPHHKVNGYRDIVNLIKEAMNSKNPYKVQEIKRNIYRGFFQGTKEFRESIYKDTLPTNQP